MLMQKSKETFPSLGDWGSYPVLDQVIEAAVAVHARLSLRFTRWRSQRILAALDDRQLSDIGVVPVITHPERNPVLRESTPRLERWIDSGCLLQITAQSLTDRFGKEAHNATWNWLRKGMVHVLASDAHDTVHRPPRLDLAHAKVTEKLGADAADMLLISNPGAILRGEPALSLPAPYASGGAPRKWFQVWR